MAFNVCSRRRLLGTLGASGAVGGLAPTLLAEQSVVPASRLTPKSVIYIFLSGGLGQQDSFDLKPEASLEIRGEFSPIATATPGVQICEHLPLLATRSRLWSLVRSLTHKSNDHSLAHQIMLSGCSETPLGFNPSKPGRFDFPAMAALVGALCPDRGHFPPAMVLPERLIHREGRTLPGQFGGLLGARNDPYFLTASRFNALTYGAWPEYGFHHARGLENDPSLTFTTPDLKPVTNVSNDRLENRLSLLRELEVTHPTGGLAEGNATDRIRNRAISLLADERLANMMDVTRAPDKVLDRYGRNSFGWSLLLARRLVREGVRFVQVYLGNNETWDTHGNAFPHLKNYLYPPMDRSLSALLDDLSETGELERTLIVVAGEFGRTPKISTLPSDYALPGRDHWGALQSVLLAGGGIPGGRVVGASDKHAGYPTESPQKPENLAATIFQTLGLPQDTFWNDMIQRPMPLYRGTPISDLT